MRCVLPAEPAVLAHLEPFGRLLLVLRRAVVATLALGAGHRNDVAHCFLPSALSLQPYSMISLTVPEPTVRPPSRIAKRAPASSATGDISSPVISVLSPGITISTPSGSFSVPVTSVVRT